MYSYRFTIKKLILKKYMIKNTTSFTKKKMMYSVKFHYFPVLAPGPVHVLAKAAVGLKTTQQPKIFCLSVFCLKIKPCNKYITYFVMENKYLFFKNNMF